MRFGAPALAGLLAFALAGGAAAEDKPSAGAVVRETVDPANPVLGQRVRLLVDVLFPDQMPAPPEVATPQAPGLQVFRFESQGATMRYTIDSRPYVGQRFEFAVFPRRAGALTVPPVEVRLMNRVGDESGRARGEAQTLVVAAPPGVDPSRSAIASSRVTLSQAWGPSSAASLHVGDALVRTITREAADTPALGFAPLDSSAPEGVRVYVDQPQSDDRIARGDLTGRRTDRLTYVFEKAGDFELPGLSQPWWDLSAKALRKATAPGKRVTVAAALASADPARAGLSRLGAIGAQGLAAIAIGAVAAVALVGLVIARLIGRGRERRAGGPSEPTLFRAVERAARAGDSSETWRALAAWKEAAHPDPGALGRLPSVKALERRLFGPDGFGWDAGQGASLIREIEPLRRESSAASASPKRPRLPPLNPATPQR